MMKWSCPDPWVSVSAHIPPDKARTGAISNALRLPWLLSDREGYCFVTALALGIPRDIERIHTTLERFNCTAAY